MVSPEKLGFWFYLGFVGFVQDRLVPLFIIEITFDSSEMCFCLDCFWRPIFGFLTVRLIIEFMTCV